MGLLDLLRDVRTSEATWRRRIRRDPISPANNINNAVVETVRPPVRQPLLFTTLFLTITITNDAKHHIYIYICIYI